MRADRLAALIVVAYAAPAGAREIASDERGATLEASGFYKNLLTGIALQPDAVRSARALATLLGQPPAIPDGGVLDAHLLRVSARVRPDEKLQLDVAWQLALTLASDPAFVNGASLTGAVAGTGAGAQRRLVDPSGVLATGPTLRLEHNLDRLAVKIALPFGDLTVGRQVLSWGTGRLWNPTDVLSPFPPTAVDREVRRGFDAVRLAIALGEITQLDLLYLPQLRAEDNGGAVRFQTNVKGWDGSISFGKYVRDLVLGADLVGDMGPVGVHAEGAYTLELLGLGTGAVTVGDHFFRGVVGAEVKPHAKLVLMVEYSYNGYGTTDPARYAAILASPRVIRGEIFGAGQHQAALVASLTVTDLLQLQLSLLANLADPSALLIPTVEYSFAQNLLIRAGAYLPLGRTPDPLVYDGLTPADAASGSEAFRAATASRGLRSEFGAASYGAFVQLGRYVP